MSIADALRILLLSQAAFTMGLSALIILAYFRVWRTPDRRRGLLPIHVVSVATSHSMLILFAVLEVYGLLGREGVTWRAPYLFVALFLSDAALFIIMRLQVQRLKRNR